MTVPFIKSDALDGVQHGFFTREGGVSGGLYDSLNCGAGSDDAASDVAQNKALVTGQMGADTLMTAYQIHSAKAVFVDSPWTDAPTQCDGMVTKTPGLLLGALSADCAPVLFADQAAGVVGAAHAGWQGAVTGITDAMLDLMEHHGATRANIAATVGPCISQRAYEVGPEFVERFTDEDPEWARFFAGGTGDRAQFDMPGYVLWRLREAGVGQAEWVGHCTYSDPKRFFSYRRTTHNKEPDYGRQIAVIRL